MDPILRVMAIFIEYPVFAAGIGLVLVGLGRRAHRRVAIGVGVVWLLYGLYESGMKYRVLCGGECNIRVDLLLIYPMLLIALAWAVVSLLRPSAQRSSSA